MCVGRCRRVQIGCTSSCRHRRSISRTARLVAADAAVRAGLDCEEIEDFRIAVDELCHLVMSATDHFVDLWVVSVDNRVIAHGHAPEPPRLAAAHTR